jgi:hypothetical protein
MKKGGATPRICDGLYTSKQMAEKALVSYIQKNDKLGFAVYPDKVG